MTTLDLINVAESFTSNFAIKKLAALMEFSEHKTQAIVSSVNDPQEAALDVLQAWRATVATPEKAHQVLKMALEKAGYSAVVAQVLDHGE